jgi:hypothetical protein
MSSALVGEEPVPERHQDFAPVSYDNGSTSSLSACLLSCHGSCASLQVMSSALEGEEYVPKRHQDFATGSWIRDCMFVLAAQMGEFWWCSWIEQVIIYPFRTTSLLWMNWQLNQYNKQVLHLDGFAADQ